MKRFKDFLSDKEQCQEDIEVSTPEELALMAANRPVLEGVSGYSLDNDPPTVLVMHRKEIRHLDEGKRVGIYFVEKLNKYVTVPYDNVQIAEETVMDQLHMSVQKRKSIVLEHNDNTTSEITPQMAKNMIELYKKINEANRAKMLEMLEASSQHFQTIAKFSKE